MGNVRGEILRSEERKEVEKVKSCKEKEGKGGELAKNESGCEAGAG